MAHYMALICSILRLLWLLWLLRKINAPAPPRPLGPSASGHCLGKHHKFRENFYKMFACYSRNTNSVKIFSKTFFIIFRVTVDTRETLK